MTTRSPFIGSTVPPLLVILLKVICHQLNITTQNTAADTSTHTIQIDDFNCGPICLLTAEQLITSGCLQTSRIRCQNIPCSNSKRSSSLRD
ncbi:hypothetical protein L596_000994 [Steinernema carpocapsae]|uniref:Secreted protein n=1 Tax=Steinernema carpocapsae TaxID=34508 RepID=A0A4U8UK44_STECR|nr:hypothetical protein L596_000994 [Steinernema carpocapsae]